MEPLVELLAANDPPRIVASIASAVSTIAHNNAVSSGLSGQSTSSLVRVGRHRVGSRLTAARSPVTGQELAIIEIDGYAWIVPFIRETDGSWTLKTAYPSRKATAQYLGGR